MEMKNYLKMLREDIHTTVMATVDGKGHPVTRVIDIMLEDGKTVYFITAKGKAFYRQLMEQKFISVSGFCGGEESILTSLQSRSHGKVFLSG